VQRQPTAWHHERTTTQQEQRETWKRVPMDLQTYMRPRHGKARTIRWIFRCRTVTAIRTLMLLLLSCSASSALTDAIEREQKIKAAYLYHLAQFIDWPEAHALKTSQHINICSPGSSAFSSYLQNLSQRKAKGREIHLMEVGKTSVTTGCNIIFFDASNELSPQLLEKYAANGTITVGEQQAFIDHGGLIALPTVENHVRLLINFDKAKATGLYISANLLEVATLVSATPPKKDR
jgi:hypothetical protein